MKLRNLIVACGAWCITFLSSAQVNYTAAKFDLQSIDAHKSYFFYPGSIDTQGNYLVKMGIGNCNTSTSYSSSGSYTIKTTTFNDISYDFLELKFDKEFQFLGKTDKHFNTSWDAQSYAPVYKSMINPVPHGISATLPPTNITPEYFTTGTVHPTISFTGFKVSSFGFTNKTVGSGNTCTEQIVAYQNDVISPKEEKGQKWYPMTSAHYPGGGDILFSTVGVYPEKDVAHFILQRYNMNLEVEKSVLIPVKFNPAVRLLQVEKGKGRKDYILVVQTATKYSRDLPIKSADYVEFIYIDGETLDIKFRAESQLTYSQWFANTVVKTDDGIIIMGPAGKDNKTQIAMPGHAEFYDNPKGAPLVNSPKELPNYQLVKLNVNAKKVEWVNGVSAEVAQRKVEVLSGLSTKVKSTPIFTIPGSVLANISTANVITNYVNGKLIISAQQLLGAGELEDRGSMFTMIFDSKGNLEKYLIKPETTFAQHQIFFSGDKKTMYWVNYELATLNDIPYENGSGALSKKVPSMFAANLHWVTIDLTTNNASNITVIGDNTWAISANNPVMLETNDEIVFVGREISKKAKDSDLIMVKVDK